MRANNRLLVLRVSHVLDFPTSWPQPAVPQLFEFLKGETKIEKRKKEREPHATGPIVLSTGAKTLLGLTVRTREAELKDKARKKENQV